MKICMILKANDLLNDVRVQKEARSLIAAGHDVTVLARKTERSAFSEELNGIQVYRFPWILGDPRRLFIEKAREIDADVYHAHDLHTLDIGFIAAKTTGAKLVYDSHELWMSLAKHYWGRFSLRQLRYALREKALIHQADCVITVSDSIARILQNAYGIRHVNVIRNVPVKISILPNDDLRKQLNISSERKILLHLGGVMVSRGFVPMIEALAKLDDFVLVSIGSDHGSHYIEKMRDFAGAKGVSARVHFLPKMPYRDMIHLAAGADIGMCMMQPGTLHHRSTITNKFFDYLLTGLPVVASDFPEMAALVDRYRIGICTDPTDPQKIADATLSIQNADALLQMKENAKVFIDENHWDKESQKLLEIYDSFSGATPKKRTAAGVCPKPKSMIVVGTGHGNSESLQKLMTKYDPADVCVLAQGRGPTFDTAGINAVNFFSPKNLWKTRRRRIYDVMYTCYNNQKPPALLMYDVLSLICRRKERKVYFPSLDLEYPIGFNMFLTERFHLNKINTRYFILKYAKHLEHFYEGFFI